VDLGYSIVQTPDNGYLAAGFFSGQMFVMRLNPFGDTLWFKLYPYDAAKTIEKTNDNNYIIANFSARLIKININGDTLWTRSVNAPTLTRINAFKEAANGGYIACGRRYYGSFEYRPYLAKISVNGTVEWETVYSQNITTGDFSDITISSDNNYLLTGNYSPSDTLTEYTFIMKTNLAGAMLWLRDYGNIGEGNSIYSIGNNKILLGGEAYFSNNPFLSIFDVTGNLIWYRKYDTTYAFASSYSSIATIDGGFAYTGYFDSTGNFDAYVRLLKTDSLGNVLWKRAYGFHDFDLGIKIRQTSDSGYIIIGQRDNYNIGEIYVIKTDKFGNTSPIGITPISNILPKEFKLYQNYPNPFNPVTTIKYDIPKDVFVTLKIYDILGKEVFRTEEFKRAGSYEVRFDGAKYASGMYFYSLEAGNYKETKKMVLIK
jgi:hypothetical protein